ncbi:MAG: LysR family transcriptional regulator [Archangium sp.]|nr:LysR family transcriptional regulator [Archangium sp.]
MERISSTHLRHVDLNLLVALAELLQSRSVTAAASRLGITQPAMSRTLGRLRSTFGDPLFVRSSTGLKATPRAETLSLAVYDVVERANALVTGGPLFDPLTTERTFVVATSDYAEALLLSRVLEALEKQAPRLKLRIVRALDADALLEQGDVDLTWEPKKRSVRTLVWSRLFDDGFAFVVRKGHPVLKRGAFTLDRFLSLRHVALAPRGLNDSNPLDLALARAGRRRDVVATVPSFLAVPELLRDTELGATLPTRIIERVAARHGLVELPLPFTMPRFDLSQAWHERMRKDPGHAWLRALVAAIGRGM